MAAANKPVEVGHRHIRQKVRARLTFTDFCFSKKQRARIVRPPYGLQISLVRHHVASATVFNATTDGINYKQMPMVAIIRIRNMGNAQDVLQTGDRSQRNQLVSAPTGQSHDMTEIQGCQCIVNTISDSNHAWGEFQMLAPEGNVTAVRYFWEEFPFYVLRYATAAVCSSY